MRNPILVINSGSSSMKYQLVDPDDASSELADELVAWCRERLSHYKCPRSIDFEAELPRLDTGKLYKRQLRARYWPT